MTLKLTIHGAAGRMGQRLIALGHQDPDLTIHAAIDDVKHSSQGIDVGLLAGIGAINVPVSTHLPVDTQALIDFSVPAACEKIVESCASMNIPIVIATTGMDLTAEARIHELARTIPIVWAPNMSLAVNLATKLTAVAARALEPQAESVDVEILERHHRFKEDAPSGTALKFGQTIAEIMGQTAHVHGREGRPGVRPRNEIGYHAIRTGDNPGEHTILFGLLGETIEITVRASSRDCYAQGALAAAKFVAGQPPGMYTMFDVLGLRTD